MKSSRFNRFAAAALATLGAIVSPVSAADGTWTQLGTGGLWSAGGNWSGGTIADGSSFTANFNTLNITADNTVHLDSARTLGNLIFGDTTTATAASWILDANAISGNILTLAGGTPTITVNALGTDKSATITAVIAGSDGLIKDGVGTLSFGIGLGIKPVNTFTGGMTIKAGTVSLTGASSAGSNVITLGDSSGSTAATLSSGGVGGGAVSYANAIILGASTGALTIGSTTGGAVTFTGGVTGTNNLILAQSSNNAAGSITFSTGSLNNVGTITNAGASTQTTPVTISSTIGSNVTGLIQNSNTTLSLTGANTFSGSTLVSAGILSLGNSLALQNSALDATNSVTGNATAGLKTTVTTLTLGGLTGTKNFSTMFTTTSGGFSTVTALTLNPGTGVTNGYSGVMANGASGMTLTKTGAGTQTLTGANIYTGATTVSGGTLNLGGGTATGSLASTVLNLGGGTLAYTRTGNTTQAFTTTNITAGSSAVTAVAGDTLTLGTLVPVAGGTVNFGTTGTITTSTANDATGILGGWATFDGTTWAVANGAGSAITGLASFTTDTWAAGNNVDVTTSSAFGSGSTANSLRFNTAAANTLTLAGTNILTAGGILVTPTVGNNLTTLTGGNLSGAASADLAIIQNNTGNGLTISSAIVNNTATSLTKSGAGLLTLTAANTYTGVTTIGAGTLQIGTAGRLGTAGSYAGNIVNNGTLQYSSSAAQTLSGIISGTGSVTKDTSSSSTLTLSGVNTFTGGLFINSGTVSLGTSAKAGGAGSITIGTAGSANATLSLGGNLAIANPIILGGSIGTMSITQASGNTTSITGGLTGTGNLSFNKSNNGGVFQFTTGILNNTGTITIAYDRTSRVDITSAIGSAVQGLTLNSPTGTTGSLTLSAANTNFIGDTTLTAGTLNLQNTNALQNSVLKMNGGAVTLGTSTTVAITSVALGGLSGTVNINLNNTLTSPTAVNLTLGNSNASYGGNTLNPTYSGVLSNTNGAASLSKVGSNTQTLGGINTYSGATTVASGVLAVAPAGSINTSSGVTVEAGAKFVYNSSTALTVATTLNGNTLSHRAVLGGSGTVGTALTLDNVGDTLAPGNSPGTLSFTQAQTWSSFSYDWEIKNFTGTAAGTDFDQVAIASTLGLSGSGGNFILNVLGLTAGDVSGTVPNFSEISRSWTILTTTGGITGFNAAHWTIDTTGFTDPNTGSWSLTQSSNNIVLSYTAIPEPDVAALLGGLGTLALLRRRR